MKYLSFVYLGFLAVVIACEQKPSFTLQEHEAKQRERAASEQSGNVSSGQVTPTPTVLANKEFRLTKEIFSSTSKNYIWTVNSQGAVVRISLDKDYPTRSWNVPGGSGHRTFVSSIGLIMGKTGGKVYRVDDDAPEGGVLLVDFNVGSRVCVNSFKVSNIQYLGFLYTKPNAAGEKRRWFSRVPIDLSKSPKLIDDSKLEDFDTGTGEWGYSCFTDQGRNWAWSQHFSDITGVNLATGQALAATSVPNYLHVHDATRVSFHDNRSLSVLSAMSYALSGDADGNLYNSNLNYTYVFEPQNQIVFGSQATNLFVAPSQCFSTVKDCKSQSITVDVTSIGGLGPMSALGNGKIAAVKRGSPNSDVFMIGIKDPKNLSLGVEIEKVASVPGDLYMYTDFTGATTFPVGSELFFDFASVSGFNRAAVEKTLVFNWESQSDKPTALTGLQFSIACYKKDDSGPKTYQLLTNPPLSSTDLKIDSSSCIGNAIYDTVAIKMEPTVNYRGDFSRTKNVSLTLKYRE